MREKIGDISGEKDKDKGHGAPKENLRLWHRESQDKDEQCSGQGSVGKRKIYDTILGLTDIEVGVVKERILKG